MSGHLNLTGPPATPRPSATVLLLRGRRPWELLLVHRPGGADFAPGAYVFPGGTVHDGDRAWGDEIRGAAIRELFEEAGILLARRGGRLAREADCARLRGLLEGGAAFEQAMGRLELEPAFDRLVMFARWVTPAQMRRRFDARFFLARLPAGQSVRPQEGEVTDWLWISPERALGSPEITLVYATRTVLESVATGEDASAVVARARRLRDIPTVEPRVVETERGWEIVRD
ncbi:MAG TPA: NUDIX hydrolase [Candidatus Dormibacteraeota bacterium]|nr:NUDIX hydrolase [Candidatus Dormibacteraeota bacterium]